MKNCLAAAAAFLVISTPAYAQEDSNFGGVKIGAVVGYDSVRTALQGDSGSTGGVVYGATAGYDFDLGTAVVGIEGEISAATVKDTVADVDVLGDEGAVSAGRDLYVGARAGIPVSSIVLLYAKAGYTNARAKVRYDDGAGNVYSDGINRGGFRIGAGAEVASGNSFARLEYRYSNYADINAYWMSEGLGFSRHQVAVTGGFRF